MSEVEMNLSVNGESKVPPGFRFHPTEEELLLYYLTKKVGSQIIDLDVIRDVDLNKLEPWDIQEKCKIGSTPQNDWYFFSHKDKKYPTGTRTNRATAAGFWKATGRDKVIRSSFKRIGMRKTLVFYKGRAPHGQKSDWIMHEYRLDEHNTHDDIVNNLPAGDSGPEEGWVVCRVFKKKNYNKALEFPHRSSLFIPKQISHPTNDVVLDQILQYMGKSCKQENDTNNILNDFPSFNATTYGFNSKFSNLPRLKHASVMSSPFEDSASRSFGQTKNDILIDQIETSYIGEGNACNINIIDENNTNKNNIGNRPNDWAAFDRLVASQLNGQDINTNSHFSCYDELNDNVCFTPIDHDFQLSNLHPYKPNFQSDSQVYNNDLWSCFAQSPPSSSSSVPLADLSV